MSLINIGFLLFFGEIVLEYFATGAPILSFIGALLIVIGILVPIVRR